MGVYVPPGQSPPFQVVDDLHHGAWLIITAALGLVLSLVTFLIRLYVRLALNPAFGSDDYVLLGATVQVNAARRRRTKTLTLLPDHCNHPSIFIFDACSKGLGTSVDLLEQSDVDKIQVLSVVSDVLYLLILHATKCCVVGIYLRLTPQKGHNRASWATIILCTLWVITAIFILTVNCGFNRPWKSNGGQCENFLARWQFILALDIATELILFGLAVFLLAGLSMTLKRKLTIAFAFVFRLPMIVFAVLHIHFRHRDIGLRDPTLHNVTSLIWGQVELNYALIACGVFCLHPFIAAVRTNYGTAGDSTLDTSRDASKYKSSGSKSGGGSGNRGTMFVGNEVVTFGAMQGDTVTGSVTGTRTQDRRVTSRSPATDEIELVDQRSLGSDGSRKMIIRKDVQYSIEYDGVESQDAGLHSEPENWDQYLESQRP